MESHPRSAVRESSCFDQSGDYSNNTAECRRGFLFSQNSLCMRNSCGRMASPQMGCVILLAASISQLISTSTTEPLSTVLIVPNFEILVHTSIHCTIQQIV